MKSLSRTVAIATLCSIALFSCSQEKMETATEEHPVEIQAGVQRPGNYAVHLGLTSATGTSTWTYTIKKENKAKDIGYFVLNLGSCGENSPTISNDGPRSGSVIWKKVRMRLAPSMAAASSRSGEMPCSAAKISSMTNG